MEILANLDDIKGNLDENVVAATDENTDLLQISIARVIRGYLSRVVDSSVLLGWNTPDNTPELIREVAGKLIAAQHYYNSISKTNPVIDPDSWPQKLYDQAMAILREIVEGTIVIPDIVVDDVASMSSLDFFPVDDTNRAFTMGMEL